MTSEEAIERCRRRLTVSDVGALFADVSERLALRGLDRDWTVMRCGESAVRLFVKHGEGHLSRYVWRVQDADVVIDHLQQRRKRGVRYGRVA